MKPSTAVLLLLSCMTSVASAADSWILRGYVHVELNGPRPCGVSAAGWQITTLFHNLSDQPRIVRSLDVSNGGVATGDVALQPQGSAALIAAAPSVTDTRLWVAHFDVPPDVVVEDRLQYLPAVNGSCGAPQVRFHPPTWQLPTYSSLSAANQLQIHLGTDVEGGPMRVNVVVFNAAAVTAAAHVEIRSARCVQTVAVRDLRIEGNGVEQISIALSASESCAPANSFVDPATYFTTVRVDQPSLSFVTVLSIPLPPSAPVTIGVPALR